GYDGVLIPGGFSFGDYLRSGAMAAVAPVTKAIKDAADAGKPVLGICNGFQILTEIALLPGALIFNDQHTFVSRNESLKVVNNETAFTRGYGKDEDVIYPVAHGEGHYYCDDAAYEKLAENNQIVLTYNENPNGSRNEDRKSTRLNSSHVSISYAVFCLKKKKNRFMTRRIER